MPQVRLPHFVFESDDPAVQDEMFAGVPFDQIQLSNDPNEHNPPEWSPEDREVANYLRHNNFSLPHRMRSVEDAIRNLQAQVMDQAVPCPACGGKIQTPRENL